MQLSHPLTRRGDVGDAAWVLIRPWTDCAVRVAGASGPGRGSHPSFMSAYIRAPFQSGPIVAPHNSRCALW